MWLCSKKCGKTSSTHYTAVLYCHGKCQHAHSTPSMWIKPFLAIIFEISLKSVQCIRESQIKSSETLFSALFIHVCLSNWFEKKFAVCKNSKMIPDGQVFYGTFIQFISLRKIVQRDQWRYFGRKASVYWSLYVFVLQLLLSLFSFFCRVRVLFSSCSLRCVRLARIHTAICNRR